MPIIYRRRIKKDTKGKCGKIDKVFYADIFNRSVLSFAEYWCVIKGANFLFSTFKFVEGPGLPKRR